MTQQSHKPIIILGGGGHAAVVAEAALAAGLKLLGYCADDKSKNAPADLSWLGTIRDARELASKHGAMIHAAVGDSKLRRKWVESMPSVDAATIIHPRAIVSTSAIIHAGTFISAGAVTNARAVIERGVIINTSVVVEHDCEIGEFTHIAPGAVLAGGVAVGRNVLIGAGAVVIPHKRIGSGVTVGAGAAVTENVADDLTVAGVPAREVGSYQLSAGNR